MPVYKVNNNAAQQKPFKPPWVKEEAPSTPSAPPWRRQQELKNPKSPSSPGPKNDPPVFPKPAEQPKNEVPPPAPGRKQSKITIIPSKPMRNGSSSMLAAPPSLPAPPPNPSLAMAPPKPAMEPTKIQVSSKIADPKKPKVTTAPVKQEEKKVEKVVPIKIETAKPPSPAPKVPSPQPVRKTPSSPKVPSPQPVRKTPSSPKVPQNKTPATAAAKPAAKPAPPKAASPPPAPKVQQNNVKAAAPKPAPPKQRSPSPPPVQKPKQNVKAREPSPPKQPPPDVAAQKKRQQKAASPPPKRPSPPPVQKPPPPVVQEGGIPPPPPPMAPPPPPPPPGFNENRKPITEAKKARIEALKSRPRRRPDWAYMMKELESGVKLKHVECNDRSKPLLPKAKAKGQFIYESEKERGGNIHNILLNQIQKGVNLKKVHCNDRSKPLLHGLRKFRRQLTIEEQMKAAEPEAEVSEDELDDIDKVRDDLQSTKQMLAFELKEKENLQKDNRRLGVKILNLEEELEKLRKIVAASGNENALVNAMRQEVETAKEEINKQELLNQEKTKQLAALQAQLEDSQHRNLVLEKRIESGVGGGIPPETSSSCTQTTDLQKTPSRRDASLPETLQPEPESDEEEEEEEEEESCSEEESESDGESEEATRAAQEKRLQRELKMLSLKLKTFKDKEITAKNERRALKYQMSNLTKAIIVEQKKFKCLQKEVNSMANIMQEHDDSDEDEEEEEEEESESETESESEPESEPDDTSDPPQFRIEVFNKKNKIHENILGALKKGNYLLKANIDKLKDDLEKQREKSLALQEDLNAVLAEIG